jgi:2-isopropylmalate synthase
MSVNEKIKTFDFLVSLGFRELEIGFPAASDTEYRFVRRLVEENRIPKGVIPQVLTQARKPIIQKTFESLEGAETAIVHLYNSTSVSQRKMVFEKDKQGIIQIAREGALFMNEMKAKYPETKWIFQYSPESFTGTEPEFALEICEAVLDIWQPGPDNKCIINLPATVEMSTPNVYADIIEWFSTALCRRDNIILSVHTHNDRGTGVAASELALLAGADRVEGTLFGNGERTGNADLITLAMNLYSQGIDPELNLKDLSGIMEFYENTVKMPVHPRHPYAGELVYTAFSGSHQDAIHKGVKYHEKNRCRHWEVPYLPIDPSDVGREFEAVIRINSQSGKGGVAFILEKEQGYRIPKAMQPEFAALIQSISDKTGKELSPGEIGEVFHKEFVSKEFPVQLLSHHFEERPGKTFFKGKIRFQDEERDLKGEGNGPVDAFFHAVSKVVPGMEFLSYEEHALGTGSGARAAAYIQLRREDKTRFGAGEDENIHLASIKAMISALNRTF